ncbi:leucine-rich repeat domain-containing protein [Fuerstiella marisgermanici]|uniref:Ran GTPase-activating protein (RanGAP) involved in mRNA processing and transport n=1 Tax=Fuerstiella marisgermanici TaxID=1891926 RepID=A0A1P8WNG3_9PLAN|nr:hypothetical protein [Fuerstiella marisgermanici]APZ95588.1 Ran GTPase-activating protein (RanGAP) involved in mRNA processing and transport [Fuerstiella marisgermanici]
MSANTRPVIYGLLTILAGTVAWNLDLFPAFGGSAIRIASIMGDTFKAQHEANNNGEVIRFSVHSAAFGDDECKQLLALTGLRSLDLSGTTITDKGLETLAKLPHLEALRLDDMRLTSTGLKALSQCESLRELTLAGSEFGEVTVDGIGGIQMVETLDLSDCGVTDASAVGLANLNRLQRLYLGRTQITGKGLQQLAAMPDLTLLNLASLDLGEGRASAHFGQFRLARQVSIG